MRKLTAFLAVIVLSLTLFVGAGTGTASAQPGCVDLGWHAGSSYAFHGVRCGNHDTWDVFGPQGYLGVAFHYWWPWWMTHYPTGSPTKIYTDDLVGGNHQFHWNWANRAPGFDYKGYSNAHGFGGDLDIVNWNVVTVVNLTINGQYQHGEIWFG